MFDTNTTGYKVARAIVMVIVAVVGGSIIALTPFIAIPALIIGSLVGIFWNAIPTHETKISLWWFIGGAYVIALVGFSSISL